MPNRGSQHSMKKRSDKENFREFIINIFKGLAVSPPQPVGHQNISMTDRLPS